MDAEMRRAMTGQMNGLFTRSGDTGKAMDGIASRDLWEAGRVRREAMQAAASRTPEEPVEKEQESGAARSVRTKVAANRAVQEKYQEQVSEEKAAEAEAETVTKQLVWVEDHVVPEDVEDLEEEGSLYEEYTAGQLERAVQRVKDGRVLRQEGIEQQVEKQRVTREQMQKASLSEAEQKLAERLAAVGMPVTEANLERLSAALGLAEQAVGRLGEGSFSYLLENGLESSIENLYRASMMSAQGAYTQGTQNVVGMQDVSEAWTQIEPQAAAKLEQEGIPVTEESMQEARWLFEHGLAIDGKNMAELESLHRLAGQALAEQTAGDTGGQVADTMQDEIIENLVDQAAVGGKPTETVLGDAREREASYAIAKWSQIDVSSIEQITMRRQMEEVRLKMTTEAAMQLLEKGIRLDTENLVQIVEGLKELENSYYQKLCEEQGANTDSQMAALLQEVSEKRQESMAFSVYAIGNVYRSAGQITFEAFHEEGSRMTAAIEQSGTEVERIGEQVGGHRIGERQVRAGEAYETMATEVRRDFGDSIKKAFRSVDSLLESLELEANEANERAVRILGYNSLEITPESVAQMRYYDSRVAETLQEMKPGTVLRLIRSGQNPLQMSMEELGDAIRELTDEGMEDLPGRSWSEAGSQEESSSRFLWKLEKQHGIREEERSAYIGIYRLLHQIEKSDGAAIGAVIEAGQELTLQNLLTAVRTRNTGGIDQSAAETTGARESITRGSASITEQIAQGYENGAVKKATASDLAGVMEPERQNQSNAEGTEIQNASDSVWKKLAAEEARQLRHTLEEPEEDYREWQARHLTEQIADSQEAVSFLQEHGIESTPALLEAAKELLGTDRQLEGFIKGLPEAERERIEQESRRVLDSLGTEPPEEFQNQIKQLQEQVLEQIQREKQPEEAGGGQILTFERLQQLRTLGRAMNLSERLAGQEHYEIPVIREDGSVSRIRLTVRHGAGAKRSQANPPEGEPIRGANGTLELSMGMPLAGEANALWQTETEEYAPIKGDFWIQNGRLEGYFRCESRQAKKALEQKLPAIREACTAAGFETGSLTVHLTGGRPVHHTVSYPLAETGQEAEAGGTQQNRPAGTRQFYQAARAVIDVIGV